MVRLAMAAPMRRSRTVEDVHPYLRAWPTIEEAVRHIHEGRVVRIEHAVENDGLAVAIVSFVE
jgi:hypothetical protein